MVHAAIHVKNNMIPELEVTSCIKDREKKRVRFSTFMIYYILAYESQKALMELYSEVDKPWMNAELRAIMVQL